MFVFGFLATAFFARELGPEAFDGFFLLLSVGQFADRIPHGFVGACQKRLAETDTPNEELLGLTLALSLGGGVVAGDGTERGTTH
jgi:O-antigen/teichoic acid export membrane protein